VLWKLPTCIYTCHEGTCSVCETFLLLLGLGVDDGVVTLMLSFVCSNLPLSISNLVQFPQEFTQIPLLHVAHLIASEQAPLLSAEVHGPYGVVNQRAYLRRVVVLDSAQMVVFPGAWRHCPEVQVAVQVGRDQAVVRCQEFAYFNLSQILSMIITRCFKYPLLAVRAVVVDDDGAVVGAGGAEVVGGLRGVGLGDLEVDEVHAVFVLLHGVTLGPFLL
jgi:hypothetical protein